MPCYTQQDSPGRFAEAARTFSEPLHFLSFSGIRAVLYYAVLFLGYDSLCGAGLADV